MRSRTTPGCSGCAAPRTCARCSHVPATATLTPCSRSTSTCIDCAPASRRWPRRSRDSTRSCSPAEWASARRRCAPAPWAGWASSARRWTTSATTARTATPRSATDGAAVRTLVIAAREDLEIARQVARGAVVTPADAVVIGAGPERPGRGERTRGPRPVGRGLRGAGAAGRRGALRAGDAAGLRARPVQRVLSVRGRVPGDPAAAPGGARARLAACAARARPSDGRRAVRGAVDRPRRDGCVAGRVRRRRR